MKWVKDNMQTRVIGFGWVEFKQAWSCNKVSFTVKCLVKKLKEIMTKTKDWSIPELPPMVAPGQKAMNMLGTATNNQVAMDKQQETEVEAIVERSKEASAVVPAT